MTELLAQRLVLRPWNVGNKKEAEDLFALASDPSIGPLCGWPPHESVEASAQLIETLLSADEQHAITLRATGQLLGAISLKPLKVEKLAQWETVDGGDDVNVRNVDALRDLLVGDSNANHIKELGYWLGVPYQGHGYMTEALTCLLAHAFDDLQALAVVGYHYADNDASNAVMRRCAMPIVAKVPNVEFRLISERHDELVHVLTADQWRERH